MCENSTLLLPHFYFYFFFITQLTSYYGVYPLKIIVSIVTVMLFSLNSDNMVSLLTNQPNTVQFSRSVMSDSLRPHEPQHARPPCPSPTPGVYPSSCPLSRWCHPTISSSVVSFSSCPQSFPASGSFQVFFNLYFKKSVYLPLTQCVVFFLTFSCYYTSTFILA